MRRQRVAERNRGLGNTLTSDEIRTHPSSTKFPGKTGDARAALEKLQPYDEILLGIVADGLDELLGLVHGLVGVII